MGSEDVIVPVGLHTYTFTYKSERQLGFFQDHDELYWNVTGNGWSFPIDKATATVKLPETVSPEDITAALYTSAQGSTAEDGTFKINPDSTLYFETTQPLQIYEGLTIVAGWPKGIVTPPSVVDNFWAGIYANLDYILGILGLIALISFYLYAWHKRGRDPKKQSIVALYESPRDFSPAFLRYVNRMGSDNKAFAAALINLAVRGHITIGESKDFWRRTTYTLTKQASPTSKSEPSEDEKVLLTKLFADTDTITLEKSSSPKVTEASQTFSSTLKSAAGDTYFKKNAAAIVGGVFFSCGILFATGTAASAVRYSVDSIWPVVFWTTLIVGIILVNAIFAWLMRAYTIEGRKLADEIEGFKLFLSATEKERLAFHNPPDKTPELFEKMLPFALALGVEHQWADNFSDVFKRLEEQGVNYVPAWYYGNSISHFAPSSFASNVGSTFAGVVSAASTPPGSSSGFSGGSSGGGGGGGGGGGW
ncbi:MAG TPA: DUF2207 domain-containing protein, partial [Flavobacterium sp.]|nr:DUF2207 domain-containing protein [Flavobacterium sp.]